MDGSTPITVTEITADTQIAADGDLVRVILADSLPAGLDLGAPIFIMYSGSVVLGNTNINTGDAGGSRNWLLELGYRLFPGTPNQITFWRGHRESLGRGDEESIQMVGFQTHSMFPPGPYPTDAGGTFQMSQAVFDSPVPFSLVLRIRGYNRNDPSFMTRQAATLAHLDSYDLGFTVAQFGPSPAQRPPDVRPQITRFDVVGDQTPTAGSIAGDTYRYDLALSQSSHASIVRIVGFEGIDAEPTTVSSLEMLDSSEFAHHSGSVTIPAGISLAEGEVYTIRAEAYEAGQTVDDTPISYRDYRITAQAAAANTRFIRVQKRINNARPTASNLIANATVIATAGTVIGDWVVGGIPNDGNDWLVGWIVPQSAAQPNHYTSGGINIDRAVAARFALTEDSVDYYVYLFVDDADADDSYNGTTLTVS